MSVATGSVTNKINEWKKRIAAPDIEELRRFSVVIRKSGMTINQLAQGYRTLQLLKRLGIPAESTDIETDIDGLTFFVNEIYSKCREYGINPKNIVNWITDLTEFTSKNYLNLYNSEDSRLQLKDMNQTRVKKIIPFISLISDLIESKKKEVDDLHNSKNTTIKEISRYQIQKKELLQNIQTLKHENESIIEFQGTFIKLCGTLLEECNIDLKEDPRPLTKLMLEFKEKNYDMIAIVEEYNKVTNLKFDIIQKESRIQVCVNELIALEKNIAAYKSLLSIHKQNWDTYDQLKVMKFGLEELKQLWLTVTEIASSRDKPREDAVAFFIKDVEENYYDKLQFEDKVKERRNELAMLNVQLNSSRQYLSIQPFIGPLLLSLYQKGITEQEIIDMNQLFQNYLLETAKSDNIWNNKNESNTNVKNTLDEGRGYQTFIDELKKYGGIKDSIKQQSRFLDEIKNKNLVLIEQRKDLLALCQNVIILINMLNDHYFYYKGFFDNYHKKNDFSIEAYRIAIPIIILVYYTTKEGQDSKEKDTKSDTTMSSNNKNNKNKD